MAELSEENVAAIMPDLDRLSDQILRMPISMNERLGVAVIAATHFLGTAAGLLEKISADKGGPELDAAGWSEAVMQMIVERAKSERH